MVSLDNNKNNHSTSSAHEFEHEPAPETTSISPYESRLRSCIGIFHFLLTCSSFYMYYQNQVNENNILFMSAFHCIGMVNNYEILSKSAKKRKFYERVNWTEFQDRIGNKQFRLMFRMSKECF